MDDMFLQMMSMARQGFFCSQIIVKMALELEGKENPDLVRAMGGLIGGMGFSGGVCGCLTGGACMIGLFASKGDPDELEDSRANEMVQELVKWFEEEIGGKYSSINCRDILEGDPTNQTKRCPQIVERTFEKALNILSDRGYEF